MMARKGNPPINVRADPPRQARWAAAAKRVGLNYSDWVRTTLDRAADPATADRIRADLERTIRNVRENAPPNPGAADPSICPHPKDKRRRMSYGTVCDRCGRMLP